MDTKKETTKPKRKKWKIVLYGVAALLVILFISDRIYKGSGSDEWKLVKNEKGIEIWTLKTPGSRIKKVKLHMQVKTKLAGLIKLIEDPTSGPDVGAKFVEMLERKFYPNGDYSAYYNCIIDLPFPFTDRQSVILILHSQDSVTKVINMNVFAASNLLPPDESYVRITHLHNTYQITPLENGYIDIVHTQDSDIGGSVPYFINNAMGPAALMMLFQKFQDFMEMEKFKNAKFDYIKELEVTN